MTFTYYPDYVVLRTTQLVAFIDLSVYFFFGGGGGYCLTCANDN